MCLLGIFYYAIDESHMWIGLHCRASKYLFEWLSGQSVQYTNWARREPNGARDKEDCVMAYWDVSSHIQPVSLAFKRHTFDKHAFVNLALLDHHHVVKQLQFMKS